MLGLVQKILGALQAPDREALLGVRALVDEAIARTEKEPPANQAPRSIPVE